MDYDIELISGFVDETRDIIEEVEPTLIELSHESRGNVVDSETVNSIFRLFHSLKSSAAFLGFNNIARLTHEAETLLQGVREGKIPLSGDLASVLCTSTDLIMEMLHAIEESYNDEGFDTKIDTNIADLLTFSKGGAPMNSDESKSAEASEAPEAEITPQNAEAPSGMTPQMEQELFTPEMYQNYIVEAVEQLDLVEEKFLALEKKGYDEEDLNSAYRAIHSFKGNSSFMQLQDLMNVSHMVETIMGSMREKLTEVTPDNISFLLEALDLLHSTVDEMNNDYTKSSIPNYVAYSDLMKEIYPECFNNEDSIKALDELAEKEGKNIVLSESNNTRLPFTSNEIKETVEITDRNVIVQPSTSESIPEPEVLPVGAITTKTAGSGESAPKRDIVRKDIRVNLDKLDSIINLAGELVIAESMVTRNPVVAEIEDENFSRAVHQLRRICNELQDASMSLRMVPLDSTFKKMVRVVHDLSRKMGKQIKLDIKGGDTEVDKTVIEHIGDPLVHIIRNSCDHGIEPSDIRVANGKAAIGHVSIEGRHEGGEVWIIIQDDGKGLNKEKIVDTAIKRGVIDNADSLDDHAIWQLIFEPGFSTADKISDVSGRGVGMDVVKRNIEKMNGHIDIRTIEGKGTSFVIRIPLTLAIIDGMLVKSGNSLYTIPTLMIKKSITCTEEMITHSPEGKEILVMGDEFLPIIKLAEVFKQPEAEQDVMQGILMITENRGRKFAIMADSIIGQQQTVIKGLSSYLSNARGTSGCTILGDGTVSLIIDISSLIEIAEEQSRNSFNKTLERL